MPSGRAPARGQRSRCVGRQSLLRHRGSARSAVTDEPRRRMRLHSAPEGAIGLAGTTVLVRPDGGVLPDIEPSQRLGRHRWTVERTMRLSAEREVVKPRDAEHGLMHPCSAQAAVSQDLPVLHPRAKTCSTRGEKCPCPSRRRSDQSCSPLITAFRQGRRIPAGTVDPRLGESRAVVAVAGQGPGRPRAAQDGFRVSVYELFGERWCGAGAPRPTITRGWTAG